MSTHLPWDLMAIGAAIGYAAGLITSIPLILWATRMTKEERHARDYLQENPSPD